MRPSLAALTLGLSLAVRLTGAAPLSVTDLRCEFRVDPMGMDVTEPRLSWVLESGERGQRQVAYRVLVASSPAILAEDRGDLWDTGKVESDQTLHVVYQGQPLPSRLAAWWKVRVWPAASAGDGEGRPSAWSPSARWTMGLLERSDWKAQWIHDPSMATQAAASPLNGYHSALTNRADVAHWVTIDLGTRQAFDAVRLSPARPYDYADTPGFLFPLRFRIDVSDDKDFLRSKTVVDHTGADVPNPGTNAPVYSFAECSARYVRLEATRLRERDANNFAFALTEIEVLRGADNVARSRSVEALNSIETGPWAKANLTDGVTVTVPPSAAAALPVTQVRKEFVVAAPVVRATAYATAKGLYELRLNGRRVGDQLLAPEWTSYRKRIQVQATDVTALLRPGTNAVGALVAEGWYAGRLMAMPRFPYGATPSFLLQLELEFADGTRRAVVTDASWQSTTAGPIRSAGIYDGETVDARQTMPGWDQPGLESASWTQAAVQPLGPEELVWQPNEPIRVVKTLEPIALTEPKPGTVLVDFGQNLVGWCQVRVQGKAGQVITLRHGEMLADDGTLYTANLRGAPQTDRFIPREDGWAEYEPRFTYHGFRYLELSGAASPPTADAFRASVFHSTAPDVGTFRCSDPSLNRLMENIVWTQRGNLMSSPNDCPQRDERFGWMGDIQAFAQTAIFNMDLAAFITKFARDIRDDQAADGRFPDFAPHPGDPNQNFSGVPAWGDAGTVVPWRAYENYADARLLAQHFESARRWVDYIHRLNPDGVWAEGRNNDYNDWLNGDTIRRDGWPSRGGAIPKEVFATAFFAHSTFLVARMAERIGRTEEARTYDALAERIRATFNRRFVGPDGRIEGDTQAGYALALNFDLLPEALRPRAAQYLVDGIRQYNGHLSTGIQTTHRAMLALMDYGHEGLAWQILTDRSFPSWLYMIDNGATTIWERWDGYVRGRGFQDAGMNSFNHWAFGAVGEWMWRHIVGLNPDGDQPGWKHFTIAPRPGGGLTWAKGHYRSVRGSIGSEWRIADGRIELDVVIPPNTTATLRIPTSDAAQVRESGAGVAPVASGVGHATYELDSGRYQFTAPYR